MTRRPDGSEGDRRERTSMGVRVWHGLGSLRSPTPCASLPGGAARWVQSRAACAERQRDARLRAQAAGRGGSHRCAIVDKPGQRQQWRREVVRPGHTEGCRSVDLLRVGCRKVKRFFPYAVLLPQCSCWNGWLPRRCSLHVLNLLERQRLDGHDLGFAQDFT